MRRTESPLPPIAETTGSYVGAIAINEKRKFIALEHGRSLASIDRNDVDLLAGIGTVKKVE